MENFTDMGKFGSSSRSLLGLAIALFLLCSSTICFGSIIWEQKKDSSFSFQNYNEIFFFIALPKELNEEVTRIVKSNVSKGTSIPRVNLENLEEVMNSMEKTHMNFHILLVELEKDLAFLQIFATISAKSLLNSSTFSGTPWSQKYLLKQSDPKSQAKEISLLLETALKDFLDKYYRTNPTAKTKSSFYIPQIQR